MSVDRTPIPDLRKLVHDLRRIGEFGTHGYSDMLLVGELATRIQDAALAAASNRIMLSHLLTDDRAEQ